MKTSKLTVCSLMTALVITLETSVALSGEAFVLLTILSTIPIYISVRISILYGITGYLCTALLLFFVSPHQALFFVCTNGLLGASLGVCRKKGLSSAPACSIGATLLLIGLIVVSVFLGIFKSILSNWLLITASIIFCIAYTLLCNWILEKIYRKYMTIRGDL